MENYSRIEPLRSYGNLQSYWTTTKLWKITVVLDYYEAMETYSRIGLLRSYGTYSRIGLRRIKKRYSTPKLFGNVLFTEGLSTQISRNLHALPASTVHHLLHSFRV
jgi:hypothetical protein